MRSLLSLWGRNPGDYFFIFGTKFTSTQLSFNPFSIYLATKTKYLDIRESAIFYPHLDFTQLFFDMISV